MEDKLGWRGTCRALIEEARRRADHHKACLITASDSWRGYHLGALCVFTAFADELATLTRASDTEGLARLHELLSAARVRAAKER